MRHALKIWPQFFQAKIDGLKPWEHRVAIDRTFSVGDEVYFHEWNPNTETFTGRTLGPVVITYVLRVNAEHDIWTHTMPPNVRDHRSGEGKP